MSWSKLTCIGKDGNNRNYYFKKEREKLFGTLKWNFFVSENQELTEDFFQASVEVIDESTVKVVMLTNNGHDKYSAKGIPDALIPAISKELEVKVVSSTNKNSKAGEFQTSSAQKVWERLEEKGIAKYEKKSNRYIYWDKSNN